MALAHRDYRRLIVSQLLSLTGSQMQVVAINWHVYLLTKSPLALGFVGLTRVVPIVVFSLWGGVVADRHDRRRVMVTTQVAMTLVALGLAAFTFAGRETLWLLYLLNALGASAVAFDGPSRQALIPRLVPPEDLPGALSLNLSVFQAGADRRPGARRPPHRPSSRDLADGRPRPHLPAERRLLPRRHLRARHDAHLGRARTDRRGRSTCAPPSREGLRFVFSHAAHGLDDGARLPGDVLLRRDLAPADLRRPGPARRRQGIRHPRRVARPSGRSRARSTSRSARCRRGRAGSSSGPSRPTARRRSSSASRAASG